MNQEPQQLLKDPNIVPTNDLIAKGIGKTNTVYTKFIKELKNYNITLMDWRFYNDGKAWLSKGEYKWTTARGTNKVKPIFWLSIWEGFFKVSFNFNEKTRAQLLQLPLTKETKDYIKNITPNGSSMKFIGVIFDVTSEKQLEDIYVLSQFRKENI